MFILFMCSFSYERSQYEGEDSESLSGLKVQLKVFGPKSIFVHLLVWALFLVVGGRVQTILPKSRAGNNPSRSLKLKFHPYMCQLTMG